MTNMLFSLAVALVMMALQTSGFPGTPPWAIAMYVPLVGGIAMIYLECRQPRRRPMARERAIPPKPTTCCWADGEGEHVTSVEQRKDPTP